MISKSILPQTLDELSNITGKDYPAKNWDGAVCFLVIENHLVLIKRSETMPSHKGQIGFMGGHKSNMEYDPTFTAIREFEEESLLSSVDLEVLGIIDPVKTSRNQVIIPVVCKLNKTIDDFMSSVKSNGEWDNLILAPLKSIMDANNWSHGSVQLSNHNYSVNFYPLLRSNCKYYTEEDQDLVLWGATAKMTLNFFQKYYLNDRKGS